MPQATPPVTPDKGPGPWALALALALHPGHTSDLGGPRVELWATQPPPLGPRLAARTLRGDASSGGARGRGDSTTHIPGSAELQLADGRM